MQWIYSLCLEMVQYIANSLLTVFSMDLDYFFQVAPVAKDILSILIAAGWALLGGTQASTGAKESRRISGAPRPPTIQTASEETTAKDSSAGTHRIKRPAAPPNGNTSKKRNKKK